jgi:uncharacterized protein YxjI
MPLVVEEMRARTEHRTSASASVLDQNLFLVKEHLGLLKAANAFDILDPETGRLLLEAREPVLGWVTKVFRFTKYKRHTPFRVEIVDPARTVHLVVHRGVSLFVSKVLVEDGGGRALGSFHQKLLSIGGSFRLIDPSGREVGQLKGKWTGWDFRLVSGDTELAHITKKWAGLGKELFTSADNYVVQINEANVRAGDPSRALILAAAICIDMVLKE